MSKTFDLQIINNLSLPAFYGKLAEADTGYLVLDNEFKVVSVNSAYTQFHVLFNVCNLECGNILKDIDFSSFPGSFLFHINAIISGAQKETNFEIEYFADKKITFNVLLIKLFKWKNDVEGVCIAVKKNEIKASVPGFIPGDNFYKVLVNKSATVFQLSDASLNITYTSDAVEDILGFSPAEIQGKNLIEFIHPNDREKVRDWFFNIRRQKETPLSLEYRVKNNQNSYTWIENNARNMLENEEIRSIVLEFRNIQSKKVADNALSQVEQRLSLLLNNTDESFIVLNSRLRIVTYNRAAQECSPYFFKLPLQSDLSVLDLVDEQENEEYVNLFEQVFKGNEIEKETSFTDDKGLKHVYNHKLKPLSDGQQDIYGVFITSTNITERRKLTEEIVIQTERLTTAQKISKLGYFEYDFFSKTIFCSEQLYEILEISKKLKSWPDLDFIEKRINKNDRKKVKSKIENSIYFANDFTIEFRLKSLQGHEKVILAMGGAEKNAVGKTAKFRVTLQDITESKKAFAAIQTLEAKFKSLFDNSIDGVLLTKETGEVISANPSICQLIGYTSYELQCMKNSNIIYLDSSSFNEMITKRKKTGSYSGELFLKHKTGHIIPVEITSIIMKDGNGEAYSSTIVRDITEKKKIEAEQKALTEELIRNNRDLKQFSYITSHNLRAPVANLIGLLGLYNHQNPAEEFNTLLIEKFEDATRQLSQTLNDLFNVLVMKSNNNNIDSETISFNNIYVQVKKDLDNLLVQQNAIIKADFSEIDKIECNRIHIESIFFNMISNAIRYSSPLRQLEINIRSYKLNEWAVVEFADNGLGIDLKRYGDRIFGLYQRFHGNKEGKGLGLYMTRSQVTAMGGKIEVESEPDKGTVFKIYFKVINY